VGRRRPIKETKGGASRVNTRGAGRGLSCEGEGGSTTQAGAAFKKEALSALRAREVKYR
jgi:hypothetical protein